MPRAPRQTAKQARAQKQAASFCELITKLVHVSAIKGLGEHITDVDLSNPTNRQLVYERAVMLIPMMSDWAEDNDIFNEDVDRKDIDARLERCRKTTDELMGKLGASTTFVKSEPAEPQVKSERAEPVRRSRREEWYSSDEEEGSRHRQKQRRRRDRSPEPVYSSDSEVRVVRPPRSGRARDDPAPRSTRARPSRV